MILKNGTMGTKERNMKKIKSLILLTCVGLAALVACGTSNEAVTQTPSQVAGQSENVTTQKTNTTEASGTPTASITEKTVTSEPSATATSTAVPTPMPTVTPTPSEAPDSVKELIDLVLNNPDDELFFKPLSDDFMYEIVDYWGEIPSLRLTAFDETGALIQVVERDESDTPMTENFLETQFGTACFSSDKKVRYIDETEYWQNSDDTSSARTDKFTWEWKRSGSEYKDKVYMSKGITEADTYLALENDETIFSLDSLKELASRFGPDYCIKTDLNSIHIKEFKQGEKLIHEEFDYTQCYIYIFDDKGEVTCELIVIALPSADTIKQFWIFEGADVVNYEHTGVIPAEWYNKRETYKNLTYYYGDNYLKTKVAYTPNPKYKKSWFSIPYLTETQINALIMAK